MGAVARRGARTGDFLAGKYLLEDCLGVGGMGEVYRATNVSLGRKVAIKLLSQEYVHIEEDVLRFLREARAAAAVRHANVVDVLDVARDDDGTPFIVQELLSGHDLEHHLQERGGKLPYDEALMIMIPVADAVGAAHGHQVVHRDLKPANIFLAQDRTNTVPKVLDFGACLFPTIAERSAKEVRMLIGTPHYMAPEQILSKSEVDARSDVWALGIILYEMLVGETPFEAETTNAVLQLVKTTEVPRLRDRVKDAPKDFDDLIASCTQRDRMKRLPHASAVYEVMKVVQRRLEGSEHASGVSATAPEPARAGAKPSPRRLLTLNSPLSEPPDADPFASDSGIRSATPPALVAPAPAPTDDFEIELATAPSSSKRSAAPTAPAAVSSPPVTTASDSSLPPVLDPRAAGTAAPVRAPPAPAVPSELRSTRDPRGESAKLVVPTSGPMAPRPPAVLAKGFERSRRADWTTAETLKFALTIAFPAVGAFIAALAVPAIGAPVGRALRGDATLASGVLAVGALVCAAALVARSLLGQKRDRFVYIAAGGSVLFGIAMIIVTSSASEAAEFGVPATMGGLSSVVAPVAPFALALGALKRAREAWLDPYSRGDAIKSAALASVMLFLALTLSPVGVVRTFPRAGKPVPAADSRP